MRATLSKTFVTAAAATAAYTLLPTHPDLVKLVYILIIGASATIAFQQWFTAHRAGVRLAALRAHRGHLGTGLRAHAPERCHPSESQAVEALHELGCQVVYACPGGVSHRHLYPTYYFFADEPVLQNTVRYFAEQDRTVHSVDLIATEVHIDQQRIPAWRVRVRPVGLPEDPLLRAVHHVLLHTRLRG